MSAPRNIQIQTMLAFGRGERIVEMCEHKGVGHSDTLTDGACEAAAQALAQAYMQARGRVQHFDVDKGLLIAGQSVPRFGGGEIIEPIKLIVCGRATLCPEAFDVGEVVIQAVADFLRRTVSVDPAASIQPYSKSFRLSKRGAPASRVPTIARMQSHCLMTPRLASGPHRTPDLNKQCYIWRKFYAQLRLNSNSLLQATILKLWACERMMNVDSRSRWRSLIATSTASRSTLLFGTKSWHI
jgi:hypothetical protein